MPSSPAEPAAPGPGPLHGLRVVELGSGVGAGYAAKLVADLGADVAKVEPPGGDPLRRRAPLLPASGQGALFAYLGTSKRSVVADPADPADLDRVVDLCRSADAVVVGEEDPDGLAPALAPAALVAAGAGLVATVASLPGAVGHGRGTDLQAQALAGLCHQMGEPDRQPLYWPYDQGSYQAGLVAAVAVLGLLHGRRRGLDPVPTTVEVSALQVLGALIQGHGSFLYRYRGEVPGRYGSRAVLRPYPTGFFPCADGTVALHCADDVMWERLCRMMGDPEWVRRPEFRDRRRLSLERPEEADAHLLPWLAGRTRADLFAEALERRLSLVPAVTNVELVESAQLADRAWWHRLADGGGDGVRAPGAPYRLSRTPAAPGPWPSRPGAGAARPAPPPRPGGPTGPTARPRPSDVGPPAPDGPLAGVRVVELGWVMAGTLPGLLLADLGAEVIKVESARRIDLNRQGPPLGGDLPAIEQSPRFHNMNRGKLGLAVDLASPASRPVLERLVARSHVVIENFSPGVLDRLGLAYDQLRRWRPDVILASVSAAGQTGPWASARGYALTVGALSGFSSLVGYEGGPPLGDEFMGPDVIAALHATVGVLAALHHHHRTGEGQHVDVSMLEATAAVLGEPVARAAVGGELVRPQGARHPHLSPHGTYPCDGDDAWVAVSVVDRAAWRGLCAAIGAADLAADPSLDDAAGRRARADAIDHRIAGWTKDRTPEGAAAALRAAGVAAAPVLDLAGHVESPVTAAAGIYEVVDHPALGPEAIFATPWAAQPPFARPRGRAPLLGEHTRHVVQGLLGFDDAAYDELVRGEVLA